MSQLGIPNRPPMVPSKTSTPRKPGGNAPPTNAGNNVGGRKRRSMGENDPNDVASDANDNSNDVSEPNDQETNDGGDNGGDQPSEMTDGGNNEVQETQDHQPNDQPIQRGRKPQPQQQQQQQPQQPRRNANNNAGRGGAASGYAPGGGNASAYRGGMRGGDDNGGAVEPEAPLVLPDDPAEAKKVLDRIESERKTDILRKKVQPTAPTHVDVSQRKVTPAVKLSMLNPDLCDLDDKPKKSQDPKQCMYFVTHLYAGKPGPNIQVEGRLTATPMVSATFDTTNFTIELHDPVEQRNWSGMSRQFKKNFVKKAVEKKWPYAGTMVNKMVFRDFYLRGKIVDPTLRDKYADPDLLPIDMVDPDTKQPIECYAPRLKAQLVMSKKNRNKLETEVLDENDMQMNPYDLRRGNKVKMNVRTAYAYYKAIIGSQMPNEYGMPCKLAIIKRLDTHEETDGGPLKRTKWADEGDSATQAVAAPAPGSLPQQTSSQTPSTGAQPSPTAPAADTSSAADAALRKKLAAVAPPVVAAATPAPAPASRPSTTPVPAPPAPPASTPSVPAPPAVPAEKPKS